MSFEALTARAVNAEYRVKAFSGLNMVRNYDGHSAGTSYRTYYDRALLNVEGVVWGDVRWRPRGVVARLGINDFSTARDPGSRGSRSLVAELRPPARGFLGKLRARYGTGTAIVAGVPEATGTFADAAREVMNERSDPRIHLRNYADAAVDRLGCGRHFSAGDHRLIAAKLGDYLAGLSLGWERT